MTNADVIHCDPQTLAPASDPLPPTVAVTLYEVDINDLQTDARRVDRALEDGQDADPDPDLPVPDDTDCGLCDSPVGIALVGDYDEPHWHECWVLRSDHGRLFLCGDCAERLQPVVPVAAEDRA